VNLFQIVPPRIAGFKVELVALTGALSRTLETAEGLENYRHTGLLRSRDLVNGITFEVPRTANTPAIATAPGNGAPEPV
jgi:hypothetical protein